MGVHIKRQGSLGQSWRLPAMPPHPPLLYPPGQTLLQPCSMGSSSFSFYMWLGMMTLPLPTLCSRAEQIIQAWTVSLFQPLGTMIG